MKNVTLTSAAVAKGAGAGVEEAPGVVLAAGDMVMNIASVEGALVG